MAKSGASVRIPLFAVFGVLFPAVAVTLLGCAQPCSVCDSHLKIESAHRVLLRMNEEALWEYYSGISLANLTDDQQQRLQQFDQYVSARGLTEQDREFIKKFSWMNPDNLTTRDKLLLMEAGGGKFPAAVPQPSR